MGTGRRTSPFFLIAALLGTLFLAPQISYACPEELFAPAGSDEAASDYSEEAAHVDNYGSNDTVRIASLGREAFSRVYGINLGANTGISIDMSVGSLAANLIVGLTRPGESFFISASGSPRISRLVRGGGSLRLGRTRTSTPDTNSVLAIVLPGPNAQAEVEQLIRLNPRRPILAIRESASDPSFLSASRPYLIEAVVVGEGDEEVIVVGGHEDLLDAVKRAGERQGSWVGESVLDHLAQMIAGHNASTSTTISFPSGLRYQRGPRGAGSTSAFLRNFRGPHPRFGAEVINASLGQPNIALRRVAVASARVLHRVRDRVGNLNYFKTAVKSYYVRNFGANIRAQQIIATQGASNGILQILAALPTGSRVAIPRLSMSTYAHAARDLGLRVVFYDHDNIAAEITRLQNLSPRTIDGRQVEMAPAAIIMNFPNNPSGKVLSASDLSAIQRAGTQGTLMINDLTYGRGTFGAGVELRSIFSGMDNAINLIELFSMSKSIGLAEVRLGAMVGDPRWLQRVREAGLDIESQIDAVRTGLAGDVLNDPAAFYITTEAVLQRRMAALQRAFTEMGWEVSQPEGGLSFQLILDEGVDSLEACQLVWEELGILLLPSKVFQQDRRHNYGREFLRVSLSFDDAQIAQIRQRLQTVGITYQQLMARLTRH